MKNFGIQLAGGSLDVYEQDLAWTWKNIRFSEGLQDAYSTDVTLPKTPNNCNILQISGLLDSTTQLFGDKISPSVLSIGSDIVNTWLQVTQITEDDITVCLYERTLPNELTQKTLNELLPTDNSTSIWPWCPETMEHDNGGGQFRQYHYGMSYDAKYAQYHPVKSLQELLNTANNQLSQDGLEIPVPHNAGQIWAMATKKTVCPQNQIQCVEFNTTDMEGNFFNLHGGQHVCNDLDFGGSGTKITYNRNTNVRCDLFIVWRKKTGTTQNKQFQVFKNALSVNTINIPSGNQQLGVVTTTVWLSMEENNYLQFYMQDTNRFYHVSIIAKLTNTGYQTTEDDYGEELKYVWRMPRIMYTGTYGVGPFFADCNGLPFKMLQTDGTYYTAYPPYISFAYFGYYCNLPEITVKNLLWGLCWLNGKKLIRSGNTATFADCNDGAVLEQANIESISPQAEEFGQTNHLCFTGEDPSNNNKISSVANVWLKQTKTLHESPFAFASNWGTIASLAQYSNPEKDVDDDGNVTAYNCDFTEIDGFAILGKYQNGQLYPLQINKMGLEKITQTMRVKINCMDKTARNADYVWVSGKKFMVIEGNTDLDNGITAIDAVLVPSQKPNILPINPHHI